MKQVFKYVVPVDDMFHTFDIRTDRPVGHVAATGNEIDRVTFWVETDENVVIPFTRTFTVVGTGHPVTESWIYCGTTVAANGALVWHLYELTGDQ